MTQVNRVDQLRKVQLEGLELFARKNQDYGDAFATYGTIGVLVRLGDKIHRLQSISSRGIDSRIQTCSNHFSNRLFSLLVSIFQIGGRDLGF